MTTEVVKLLQAPDIRRRFADLGAEPTPMTPEAFRTFLQNDIAKWEKVVKASGAKVE